MFEQQGRSHSTLTFALDGSSSLREWIPAEQLDQAGAGHNHNLNLNLNAGSPSVEPSASLTLSPPRSSGDEPPMRNLISEAEWVEQDEPGVFITLRQLTDGTKHIRRLRFRYYIYIMHVPKTCSLMLFLHMKMILETCIIVKWKLHIAKC